MKSFKLLFNNFNKFEFAKRSFHSTKSAIEVPTVTILPGDGVWPNLIDHLKNIFELMEVKINLETKNLSELSGVSSDSVQDVVESFKRNKVGIKGIIATPLLGPQLQTVNMKFRSELDLFANVMIVKSFDGVPTRHKNVDFVVIREQTEGEYSALEHESVPGVIESLKIVTRTKSERIAKFAFDFATKHGRKKVTAVHKANIMKLGDGLFLDSCKRVSTSYPGIQLTDIIVDNCCMQLVSNPQQFDVLVTPNLYGAIVDNVAAGLIGGAGLVPGASFGHNVAIFEPGSRHPFSIGAGKNIANPIGLFLSAVGMLKYIDMHHHASRLESAVLRVLKDGQVRTEDIGGKSSTTDIVQSIISHLN